MDPNDVLCAAARVLKGVLHRHPPDPADVEIVRLSAHPALSHNAPEEIAADIVSKRLRIAYKRPVSVARSASQAGVRH